MKRSSLLFVIGAVVVVALVWVASFLWQNLRGSGPAFLPSDQDIVDILKPATTTPSTGESSAPTTTGQIPGMPLQLPAGFRISIFAKDLPEARVLIADPVAAAVLVSLPSSGKVVALVDKDGNGQLDKRVELLSGLNKPHGLALWTNEGATHLYVAETDKVRMYEYDSQTLQAKNGKTIIPLPTGGRHTTRSLLILPGDDGTTDRLLISIGSSCDVCREKDARRAAVYSANLDGSDFKEYAKGLRNSVFLTLKPGTNQVWATEMGRDLLGDDLPPDEVNRLEEGKNYGWPICYGKNIHDDQFDKNTYIRNPCQEPFETPGQIDLQAHSAPLGLAFIPNSWPEEYRGDLLVAFHGSWNRSVPTGYKVVRFIPDEHGTYSAPTNFISGWLTGDKQALGRPVGLLFDGNRLFISDDKAGVIYEVLYDLRR